MQGAGQLMAMAKGGQVQRYADGGLSMPEFGAPPAQTPIASANQMKMPEMGSQFGQPINNQNMQIAQAPQISPGASSFEDFMSGIKSDGGGAPSNAVPTFSSTNPGADALASGAASMVSMGKSNKSGGGGGGLADGASKMLPMLAMAAANGGQITNDVGAKMKKGGHVPGKPKVKGNSYANDTVKALLSPGEVVIPNSVMQSDDPVNNAAKFVAHVLAKKRMRK